MNIKKDMHAIALKIVRHQKGLRDPRIMHPEREWLVGLGVAFVIFLVSAYWSGYAYWKHKDTIDSAGSIEKSEIVVYRESIVKKALSIFTERDTQLQQLLTDTKIITNTNPETTPDDEAIEILPQTATSTVISTTTSGALEIGN
jgi:hypothetical protein